MAFQVAARAVLELGAELISSDEIAIYELVKNAFDAGSPNVKISFQVQLRRTEYEMLDSHFEEREYEDDDGELREPTVDEINEAAEDYTRSVVAVQERLVELGLKQLSIKLVKARTRERARVILRNAYDTLSSITICDTGDGMSLETLNKAFLTIGTPHRLIQRRAGQLGKRKVLGEKGVGRLSAMRLGSKLEVTTSTSEEKYWNRLSIDWDKFAVSSDALVGDIEVKPIRGEPKRQGEKGTTIAIYGLETDWTKEKLESIAIQEFSRISDPFAKRSDRFPLEIDFNGEHIKLRRLSSELFNHAHGVCSGSYTIEDDGAVHFDATFAYNLYNETATFRKDTPELVDAITGGVPNSALRTLGPFSFKFYWFNRKLLKGIDGIGDVRAVKNLVNSWSGGLMVFRDGFRVNPYGGRGDDWLELNKRAFKSSGYLLNTDQLIGRLQIDSDANPRLVDQTNREGLRDTFEFQALRNIMHHFITHDVKKFIDQINNDYAGLKDIDMRAVERNVEAYEKRVERNIAELKKAFPGEEATLDRLRESFQSMRYAYNQARDLAQKSEDNSQRLLDLAGVGLLVEVIAHELARATKNTLDMITSARRRAVDDEMSRTFTSLESQLQTIERRLRVLDPMSVSGRQRRTKFDLTDAVRDVFAGRAEELSKASVRWEVEAPDGPVRIEAVKGMIYQIVENLLSNSIHWLGRAKEEHPRLAPQIRVTVRRDHGGSFHFFDNGPGISARLAQTVFDAFFTTRGEAGRGLGLYIARSNAQHHGGEISLAGLSEVHPNRFNTLYFRMTADENN